jgi:hypothetical protein
MTTLQQLATHGLALFCNHCGSSDGHLTLVAVEPF